MSLIELLALVGAFSGVSSIVWNTFQWLQGRPKLKVTAGIRTMIDGQIVTKNMLMVKIVNTGRWPIIVQMIGGKNSETNFIINAKKLPKVLQGEEVFIDAYPSKGIEIN